METNVTTGAAQDSKTLYMSLELSLAKWKLAFSDGGRDRARLVTIEARDFDALKREVERAKRSLNLPSDSRVCSLYEAGRDGFALHRKLIAIGIENIVIDPASIEVSRHARRAKTDTLDAESLVRNLIAFLSGNGRLAVVRVPNPEDEARRQPDREITTLQKEIGQHSKRIQSLLFTEGIAVEDVKPELEKRLGELRTADGRELSGEMVSRIKREFARLDLAKKQLKELSKYREAQVECSSKQGDLMKALVNLKGVGKVSAFRIVVEFFGWRNFSNRRELAQAAGLAPTPFASGKLDREQGISKVGNKRVRALMIELAWCWLRFQPDSELARWFNERFGVGRRSRRVGIVAVARRLLIDLWRYVVSGEVPRGANLKTLSPKAAT